MKKFVKESMVIVAGLVLLQGCTALISDSMIKSAHQAMDKNHDGYIDYNEYLIDKRSNSSDEDIAQEAKDKGMTEDEYLKWDFSRPDRNRDGKISAQELIDLVRK